MILSLWNLTGISAALLPRCLLNFRAIGKVQTRISRLRDFTRSCGKTSYRLVNRGPGLFSQQKKKHIHTPRSNYKPFILITLENIHGVIIEPHRTRVSDLLLDKMVTKLQTLNLQCNFINENWLVSIISYLKYTHRDVIDKKSSLFHKMTWCRTSGKPLLYILYWNFFFINAHMVTIKTEKTCLDFLRHRWNINVTSLPMYNIFQAIYIQSLNWCISVVWPSAETATLNNTVKFIACIYGND